MGIQSTLAPLSIALCAAFLAACGATGTAAPQPSSAPAAQATAAPAASTPASAATAADSASAPVNTTAAPAAAPNTTPQVALREVASGFQAPLYLTHAGDGSGRSFVVEKRGTIAILRDGKRQEQPFLDISAAVGSDSSEQGLLSVAFHPQYTRNGYLFVNYTDQAGDTVIARYNVSDDPDVADAESAVTLLTIDQPAANHNGGLVMFGPDGYLYIGMGDGGRAGDPWGNAQNPQALLGKLLRIDVDNGQPYAIPQDNPFADGQAGQPEIWALGLRNPWRFSFDRQGGALWVADVGQNAYEEINLQQPGQGGLNYGWNVAEGLHCFSGSGCDTSEFLQPVAEYSHDQGCSVTGGYVYRGTSYPQMAGAYFFGDYCSGALWSLTERDGSWSMSQPLQTGLQISSFGEDEAGELYLTSIGEGKVYQLVVG